MFVCFLGRLAWVAFRIVPPVRKPLHDGIAEGPLRSWCLHPTTNPTNPSIPCAHRETVALSKPFFGAVGPKYVSKGPKYLYSRM